MLGNFYLLQHIPTSGAVYADASLADLIVTILKTDQRPRISKFAEEWKVSKDPRASLNDFSRLIANVLPRPGPFCVAAHLLTKDTRSKFPAAPTQASTVHSKMADFDQRLSEF